MPKFTLKTLLVTAAIGGITIPAIAQVTRITEPVNVPTRSIDADFVLADADEDGGLDRNEFVSFAPAFGLRTWWAAMSNSSAKAVNMRGYRPLPMKKHRAFSSMMKKAFTIVFHQENMATR